MQLFPSFIIYCIKYRLKKTNNTLKIARKQEKKIVTSISLYITKNNQELYCSLYLFKLIHNFMGNAC